MKIILDTVTKQVHVENKGKEIPLVIDDLIDFDALVEKAEPLLDDNVNLKFIEFDQATIDKYTEEGILCPRCDERYPTATRFIPIHAHLAEGIGLIVNPGYQFAHYRMENWCPDCTNAYSIHASNVPYRTSRFATQLLGYSEHTNAHYLKNDLYVCECGRYIPIDLWSQFFYLHPTNNIDDIMALIEGDMGENVQTTGCTLCLSEHNAYISTFDFFTPIGNYQVNFAYRRHWGIADETIVANTPNEVNADTLFLRGQTLQFDLAAEQINKKDILVPLSILQQLNKTLCPCGIVSNDADICQPCRTTEGEYVPISETVEI